VIDLEKVEFLCPVCRRMGNTLIPLVPDSSIRGKVSSSTSSSTAFATDFETWLRGTQAILTSISNSVSNAAAQTKEESSPSPADFTPLEASMDQLVSKVCSIQRKIGHDKITPDERVTPLLWSALGATIASAELANRDNPVLVPFPDLQTGRLMKCLTRAGLAHRRKYQTDPEGKWASKTTLRRNKQLDQLRQVLAGEASVNNNKQSALLLLDLFGVLVRLVILWPTTQGGGEREFTPNDFYHLLKLLYIAHLAQIQVYISVVLSKVDTISERLNLRWKPHFPKVTKVPLPLPLPLPYPTASFPIFPLHPLMILSFRWTTFPPSNLSTNSLKVALKVASPPSPPSLQRSLEPRCFPKRRIIFSLTITN
jgi:hypothetical protein